MSAGNAGVKFDNGFVGTELAAWCQANPFSAAQMIERWRDTINPQAVPETTEARRLLAAEDARQDKLHELLEAIREQIRLEVAPEHRPEGLFNNIQNAVYAMRGRTRLMNDAAILVALPSQGACICQEQHRRGYCTEPGCPYSGVK
ncbi:hypothetical protein [Bradyrhizobium sp. RDM4]|uniref:hypothetical protein n=1 Tax=Bradyrhizobium sp. RDM4 TaxID=3378765 RepID=UPI0038FBEF47